eukprot:2101382-Lingulodinium_polyedra.AAC.1
MLLILFVMTLRIHSPTCIGRARGFSGAVCSPPVSTVGVARAAGRCCVASPCCVRVTTAASAAAKA